MFGLVFEMLGQQSGGRRRTGRDRALRRLRLSRAAIQPARRVELVLRALVGEDVLDRGVVAVGDGIGGLDAVAAIDGVLVGADFGRALGRLGRFGIAGLGAVLALEQRIAQQFGIDEVVELEMAQLQQPDRLHQLRRQRQALRLADLKTRRQVPYMHSLSAKIQASRADHARLAAARARSVPSEVVNRDAT